MNQHRPLVIAVTLCCATTLLAQQRPNIVLFLVDDMGWEDTSLPFTSERTLLNNTYHTPNMERLAQMGVQFTHAYANSISSPSRVSLFTGANAARHRVTNWTLEKDKTTDGKNTLFDFSGWNCNGISPVRGIEHSFYATCLPELLRQQGYTTMMVGKAHFGAIDTPAANPLNIGFDYNIAGHAAGAMGSYLGEESYGWKGDSAWAKIWAVPDLEKYHNTHTFLTEALTLEAKRLMDNALEKKKPFFMYLSHYAVHAPFATDSRYYDKYIAAGLSKKEAQYAGLLEGMDKSLGDILDYLQTKGIAQNTIVIFMSDNGGYTLGRPDKNAPLSGGKGSLREGGIREPMIVYWPGVTKPNTIQTCPVIIEDFFPTILEMAGKQHFSTPQVVDGKSFVELLRGKKSSNKRALFFHFPNDWGERQGSIGEPQSAVIEGDYKLIYYYEKKQSCLYNIKEDLAEQHDLSSQTKYHKKLLKLQSLLTKHLRETNATLPITKRTGKAALYPDGSE